LHVVDRAVSLGIDYQGGCRQECSGAVGSFIEDRVALAIESHRGFVAPENDVAVFNGAGQGSRMNDVEASGVLIGRSDGVGAFVFGEDVAGTQGGDGVGIGFTRIPVNDVDPVAEEVCEMATAEIPEPAPVGSALRSKGWSGAEPRNAFQSMSED